MLSTLFLILWCDVAVIELPLLSMLLRLSMLLLLRAAVAVVDVMCVSYIIVGVCCCCRLPMCMPLLC